MNKKYITYLFGILLLIIGLSWGGVHAFEIVSNSFAWRSAEKSMMRVVENEQKIIDYQIQKNIDYTEFIDATNQLTEDQRKYFIDLASRKAQWTRANYRINERPKK